MATRKTRKYEELRHQKRRGSVTLPAPSVKS